MAGARRTRSAGAAARRAVRRVRRAEARIENPILPLAIFRVPALAGAAAVRALVFTGMFAVFFFGALYLEQIRGLSPLETGVAFLPMTLTVAALSLGPVARLVVRFGPQAVLLVGTSTLIVGLRCSRRRPATRRTRRCCWSRSS